MHVGCFIFGGGGVESRPVDGGWGVCKKVLLLPQNGVILVRPIMPRPRLYKLI